MGHTENPGIDYGFGKTNSDAKTGIRYGVIPQSEVGEAWYEDSEPYYGEPQCPECDADAVEYDDDAHNEYAELNMGADLACEECCIVFGSESAHPESPYSYYYNGQGYQAECGEDGDIFIMASPYYTWCQFCSPCAPGAGYITNWTDPDVGVRAYCFGHDWYEDDCAPYPAYSVETRELVPGKGGAHVH